MAFKRCTGAFLFLANVQFWLIIGEYSETVLQYRLCLTAYSTSMMKIDMVSQLIKPTLKLNTP
jgi:hypothetical protein